MRTGSEADILSGTSQEHVREPFTQTVRVGCSGGGYRVSRVVGVADSPAISDYKNKRPAHSILPATRSARRLSEPQLVCDLHQAVVLNHAFAT